jgi:hypothetical protein
VPRSTVRVQGARAEKSAVVVKTYIVSRSPSSLLRLHRRPNVNQSATLTTSFSSPLVPCDGSGAQPHGCAAMFSCLCAGLRAVELSPHDGLRLLGHSCPCACRRRAITSTNAIIYDHYLVTISCLVIEILFAVTKKIFGHRRLFFL